MRFLLALGLLLPAAVHAQAVVQLQAGASNSFGNGGGFLLYGPDSETRFSAGVIDGRFEYSGAVHFEFRKWDVVVGDNLFSLTSGPMSLAAPVRGVSAYRTVGKNDFYFFTGALGKAFSSPYFYGIQQAHIGAGMSFRHRFSKVYSVGSIQAIGQRKTSLENAEARWKHFRLYGQAGWLESNPQVSADAAFMSKHIGLDANRSTYIFNVTCSGCAAAIAPEVTTNSFSAYGGYSFFNASASMFESALNSGRLYSAGMHFNWLQIQASDYVSAKNSNQLLTVTEHGLHLSVTEYISHSNGGWNGNLGASYTSNRFSASVSYQELYFPLLRTNPFRKVLNIQFSIRVRSGSISTGQVIQPNGHNQWQVSGSDYAQTSLHVPTLGTGELETIRRLPSYGHGGKFVIEGFVVDTDGKPVEGASVMVDKDEVFTDSQGHFSAREKHKQNSVRVNLDDFMTAGTWEVVSAPTNSDQDIHIVLRKVVR